ncbi:MAG: PBSX family phage terminase large subunit, partial [Ruminococcus sp.]|nr:PBSX family phage terminase large subunit [Ruminococcus sp.]
FRLSDNPSLSPQVIARYRRLYTGTFYQRFIMGKWTAAEGLVYPMFDPSKHTFDSEMTCERYVVSCDYGTVNPSSFGLWGQSADTWYRLDEYYYDSRVHGERRTDEEHYEGLCRLIGDKKVECIVCDPSAQSFIQCISRHGKFSVMPAKNDVVWGIRMVSDCIRLDKIKFSSKCVDTLREFSLYRWDEKAGKDCPIKENDHAMDDIRYFVTQVFSQDEQPFYVMSLER